MPLDKPLTAITPADLQALIDGAVPEGKTIDYKEALLGNSRDDKKEFLADVSSFANASGGHLVFGMQEVKGAAVGLPGLHGIDPDAEILRMDNILRDGIKPRIPGVAMRPIPLPSGAVAIVINIPRSWAQPHVVDHQGHWRFYARNSAGKYQLDVGELRAAFTLSETLSERIRLFRTDRLGKIIAGETPIEVIGTAKIVMHIVPLVAFDPVTRFDMVELAKDPSQLSPIGISGWNNRHNFDGLLTFTPVSGKSTTYTYLQIFRNGILEAVDSGLLETRGNMSPHIPSISFEEELIKALSRFLAIQRTLGVAPPLVIMLSLLGVAGYTMAADSNRSFRRELYPIERNELIVSDILVEDFNVDAATVLRPAFDAIWNACGWPQSINYDAEGKWTGNR